MTPAMDVEAEMRAAIASRDDVIALACMDRRAGVVLDLYEDEDADPSPLAAMDAGGWGDASGDGAASSVHGVRVVERVPHVPDLVIVALARDGTKIAPLRAFLQALAGRVGRTA